MIKTSNKTDWLTLELRREIMRMSGGEPFPPVRQLISQYGVSQPTVMAALKRLKNHGLLESHGRGTIVSLKDTKCKRILLLQPDWPSEYVTDFIPHIQEAVNNLKCELIRETYDYKLDVPPAFSDYDADLIIHDSPTGPQLTPENIDSIMRTPIPVIICRTEVPVRGLHYVSKDNHAAGAEVATYLHRMGHQKVALLNNEPRIKERSLYFRCRSFENIASIYRMEIEFCDCGVKYGERAISMIDAFAQRIKSGNFDFTAVFVITNGGANYLIRKLKKYGIRVPEDISIITSGDIPVTGEVSTYAVSPTAYIHAIRELAERLLSRTEGDTQLSLPVTFIDRGTVANLTMK